MKKKYKIQVTYTFEGEFDFDAKRSIEVFDNSITDFRYLDDVKTLEEVADNLAEDYDMFDLSEPRDWDTFKEVYGINDFYFNVNFEEIK